MCVIASARVSSGGFVDNGTEIAFLFHRATVSPLSWPVLRGADDGAAKGAPASAVTAASPRLANTTVRADTLRFLIIFIVLSFVLFVFLCFCCLVWAASRSPRSVVVQDRSRGDRIAPGPAEGVEELHGEGLVRLALAVPGDRDRDRLAPDARREGQGAARRVVVRLRERGAGDRAVVHADRPLARAAAAHREPQIAAAAVA